MNKIIVGIPFALISAAVLSIAWANLAPKDDVSAEKNPEKAAVEATA